MMKKTRRRTPAAKDMETFVHLKKRIQYSNLFGLASLCGAHLIAPLPHKQHNHTHGSFPISDPDFNKCYMFKL